MVGLDRFELSTSRLSGVRSNHLSYRPDNKFSIFGPSYGPILIKERFDLSKLNSESKRLLSYTKDGSCDPFVHLRKEVIQPQVPLRLPCYDFTPVTSHTLDACFP
jgi:hypothetical protein